MRALLLLVLALALVPAASGAHTASCRAEQTAGVEVYVVASATRAQAWLESNGEPGLQRAACTNAQGGHVGADTLVHDTGRVDVRCPLPNVCLF